LVCGGISTVAVSRRFVKRLAKAAEEEEKDL
jgi:hypothetical protein